MKWLDWVKRVWIQHARVEHDRAHQADQQDKEMLRERLASLQQALDRGSKRDR